MTITIDDAGQAQIGTDLDGPNTVLLLQKAALQMVSGVPVNVDSAPQQAIVHAAAMPPVNRINGR